MMRVYVAGKLNANAVDYIKNVHRMIDISLELRKQGFAVYTPCNDFMEGLVHGSFEYADYFENSQEWLKVSDVLFLVPGWETSEGTAKECKLAGSLGIPIYDRIENLIEWRRKTTIE